MSYLDKIIDTDGWGDKKNSKIFELMKHNQEKFGYRNVRNISAVAAAPVVNDSVDSAPMAPSEVKPAPVLKPYRPFEAKHIFIEAIGCSAVRQYVIIPIIKLK